MLPVTLRSTIIVESFHESSVNNVIGDEFRFCLGYSAIAVGKLMTLGGLGVWYVLAIFFSKLYRKENFRWIIDICLLVTGNLMPADDSNWEPYY